MDKESIILLVRIGVKSAGDETDNIIALVKTYLKLPDAKPAPVKPTMAPVKP
mgnify:CR=1 FL=1